MEIPPGSKELLALQESLRAQGVEKLPICRYGDWEYALPSNEEEYIKLRGMAVLRLEAHSDTRNELPLKKAYFRLSHGELKGQEAQLPRLWLGDEYDQKITDKSSSPENLHFVQVSFWLFPVNFLADEGSAMVADFNEGRDGFCLRTGNWNLDDRILRIVHKHAAQELTLAPKIDMNFLSTFVSREFPGRF